MKRLALVRSRLLRDPTSTGCFLQLTVHQGFHTVPDTRLKGKGFTGALRRSRCYQSWRWWRELKPVPGPPQRAAGEPPCYRTARGGRQGHSAPTLQDPSGNPKGSPASPWPQQGGGLVTAGGNTIQGQFGKKDTVSVKPVVNSLCSGLSKPVIFISLKKRKLISFKKKKTCRASCPTLLNWLHPSPTILNKSCKFQLGG